MQPLQQCSPCGRPHAQLHCCSQQHESALRWLERRLVRRLGLGCNSGRLLLLLCVLRLLVRQAAQPLVHKLRVLRADAPAEAAEALQAIDVPA